MPWSRTHPPAQASAGDNHRLGPKSLKLSGSIWGPYRSGPICQRDKGQALYLIDGQLIIDMNGGRKLASRAGTGLAFSDLGDEPARELIIASSHLDPPNKCQESSIRLNRH